MNNKMMRGKLQILRDWLADVEDDGIETPVTIAQYAMLIVDMLMEKVAAIPAVTILRDGQPVAEFTDASLARMAVVMFQSNEEANGNSQHVWTVEGE